MHSAGELGEVLAASLRGSDRPTIGDVGAFRGPARITVRLNDTEFVLNRNTKRAAARASGAARLEWRATTGRRETVNRVTYIADDAPMPGWHAYLRDPLSRPARLTLGRSDSPGETFPSIVVVIAGASSWRST